MHVVNNKMSVDYTYVGLVLGGLVLIVCCGLNSMIGVLLVIIVGFTPIILDQVFPGWCSRASLDSDDGAEIIFDVHRAPMRHRANGRALRLPDAIAEARAGNVPLYDYRAGGDPILVPNYVNDVHDRQIQQSIVDSIDRLKTWYRSVTDAKLKDSYTLIDIKHYIFSCDATPEIKEKAYNVFRTIVKANERLHYVGLNEMDILLMVWHRICDECNVDVCGELKSSLLEAMADSAITIDMPYCLTGRISRIVQSLQCLDSDGIVDIKSLDTIRREIQDRVPIVLSSYFREYPEQRTQFDSGSPLSDQFRTYMKLQLSKDYPSDDQVGKVIAEQIATLEV